MAEAAQGARPVVVSCVFCGKANRVDLSRLAAGPRCGECGRPIRLDRPLKVTDADFEQTIQGASVPVLVDFHADWCGPCHMLAPTIDDLAHRRAGQILVLKLDTDANQATAARFGIKGLPTLIAFRHGKESARHIGVVDAAAVDKMVE